MTPAGIEPATFRFVAQHLNHCASVVPCVDGSINDKVNTQTHSGMNSLKCNVRFWTGTMWLKTGRDVGFCESCREPVSCLRRGEFIDWLRNCKLVNNDWPGFSAFLMKKQKEN